MDLQHDCWRFCGGRSCVGAGEETESGADYCGRDGRYDGRGAPHCGRRRYCGDGRRDCGRVGSGGNFGEVHGGAATPSAEAAVDPGLLTCPHTNATDPSPRATPCRAAWLMAACLLSTL